MVTTGKERRKETRVTMRLPVRVKGWHADGSHWEELTTSSDTSEGGCSLELSHRVDIGHVLQLTMPLPKRFRRYALNDSTYRTYALVRVASRPAGRVGVLFMGMNAPRDFLQNPGGRYLLPGDPMPKRPDRRRMTRLEVFLNLRLKRLDADGQVIAEEPTVTENFGSGGLRVMTSLPIAKDERVIVSDMGGTFEAPAAVRNAYRGPDGVSRLNLQFVDADAPRHLGRLAGVSESALAQL